MKRHELQFKPLTPETWPQLEQLFGPRGACGGCWCMTWRQSSREYERNKGETNKQLLQELVNKRKPLGVLAFRSDGVPVGWCSVSPRETLPRLENSRLLKRVDQQPVWSIACLYIPKMYQRQGWSSSIIDAATAYAFELGAKAVEAYPVVPKKSQMPAVFAWVGFEKSFQKAGFQEVSRPSASRCIMRRFP